jgi:hypothetical protein
MKTISRSFLRHMASMSLASLAAATVVGCSGGAGESTANGEQELYQGNGATLFTNGNVPVCYATSDGNNPTLLGRAQTLLSTIGWGAVANVQFTGWGACPSTTTSDVGMIRVHFVVGSNAKYGNGSTAYEGTTPRAFNDLYLVSDDTAGNHFQYEVLHEFGHAIGWDHEQQRPENWPTGPTGVEKYCTQNQVGQGEDSSGTARTSYFDTQSLMSYCTGWPQHLSPGDVAGVQNAYGKKTPIANGQNGSNNAASRAAGNIDTFFAHADGSVWTSYWYNGFTGSQWPTFKLPGAGSASSGMPIASVSRASSNLDIFYAGTDGAIHSSYWGGGGWGSLVLPGTAGLATSGEQIAAVSGSPGAIEVVYAGTDKNLYWSHWSGQCGSSSTTQCGWGTPQKVVSDGSIPLGAAVTAVARTPDRLDIFYVESDGVPHSSACFGVGNSCKAGAFANFKLSTAASCAAPVGAPITATARTANNLDIFYVNSQGAICTSYWYQGANWGSFPLSANNVAPRGGQLSAVTRSPNNLDVFWETANSQGTGDLWTAYWYAGAAWGVAHVAPSYGGNGVQGRAVGAVARTQWNLDVFEPGYSLFGGGMTSLTTAYWFNGSNGWSSYATNSY